LLTGVAIGFVFNKLPTSFFVDALKADSFVNAVVATSAISGRASVVDGDTIEIRGERIRFHGIDAPESNQLCQDGKGDSYRCGSTSANALDKFLAKSQPIRCDFVERDRYGRFVGNCFRADNVNIAASLVRSGLALDWPRYSNGFYVEEQETAKAERIGVWQGKFELPWEWRAQNREPDIQQRTVPASSLFDAGASGCNIKGNISDRGERIYHLPGQRYYDKTKISEGKGERWFCSEAEARAAGWRKAKT
jgi:endonuclease YncB( thermonuclease family)